MRPFSVLYDTYDIFSNTSTQTNLRGRGVLVRPALAQIQISGLLDMLEMSEQLCELTQGIVTLALFSWFLGLYIGRKPCLKQE